MLKAWVLALTVVFGWLGAAVVVLRVGRPRRRLLRLVLLALPAPAFFLLAYVASPPDLWLLPEALSKTPTAFGLANGLLVLALLGANAVNCYFHFDRSIQLRLLREFDAAGESGLSLAALGRNYGNRRVMGRRLAELMRHGFAEREGFRYRLTPLGRLLAGTLEVWRRLFPIDPEFPPGRANGAGRA